MAKSSRFKILLLVKSELYPKLKIAVLWKASKVGSKSLGQKTSPWVHVCSDPPPRPCTKTMCAATAPPSEGEWSFVRPYGPFADPDVGWDDAGPPAAGDNAPDSVAWRDRKVSDL